MAKTARKKRTTRSRKKKGPRLVRTKKPQPLDVAVGEDDDELQVKGGKLVVRLSRESHPEVFDLDRLCKQIHKMLDAHGRKKAARDLCSFLAETEKGLQILLRNHLEDAMRKYLQ